MTCPSKPPTSSRARPAFVSFAGPFSFTVHHLKVTISSVPTTYGDIQQKKCARGVGGNRKSTESTFGPRFSKPLNFPRDVQNTFGSEPFHFRVKKVFSHANNDFDQSHLTPMITSQNNPENQISRGTASVPRTLHRSASFLFWSLVLGNWSLKTRDLNWT
jgi:hypothetical protein